MAGDRIAHSMDMEWRSRWDFSAHLVEGFEQMCPSKPYGRIGSAKESSYIDEYEKIFFEEAQLDAESRQPSSLPRSNLCLI